MKPLALIVEDEPQLADLFDLTLRTDFRTEICDDGLIALARLKRISPAIVILDLNLPGASGKEILALIRKNKRLELTSVVLATADHSSALYLQDQADIVLLKPISPMQLYTMAKRLCNLA